MKAGLLSFFRVPRRRPGSSREDKAMLFGSKYSGSGPQPSLGHTGF